MAAFDRIKAGDTLYDVHRVKCGNTTMSREPCFTVYVISVDKANRTAMCSWNSNGAQRYNERKLKRLRRSKPMEKS